MVNFEKFRLRSPVIRREVRELYLSVAIKNFALSLIALFEAIYLYEQLGLGLRGIVIFYACLYALYFLLLPLGGKICARFGFEHAILYSVPFLILYYGALFMAQKSFVYLCVAPVLVAVYKTLFWPAYHATFAHYGQAGQRGKEVGYLEILNSFVLILGPILGSLIITYYSFQVLFIVVGVLMFTSTIPLFLTKEIFTPGHFSYKHAFQKLFYRQYRRFFLGFLGQGELIVQIALWPIFIYAILRNYLQLGSISSLAILLTAVISLFIGRIVDREGIKKMLHFSAVGNAIAFFLRLLVGTAGEVFMVDSLSRIFTRGTEIPLQVLVYEKGAVHGRLPLVVFFEMVIALGCVLFCGAVLLLFLGSEDLSFTFILAGIFSLFYLFLK